MLGLVVCFELGLRLETAGTGSLVIGSKQPVLCTVLHSVCQISLVDLDQYETLRK